jgi:predicted phosphodiesterase
MRLLVTADVHYDNPRSRRTVDALLDDLRRLGEGADALLVIGDVGNADDDWLAKGLDLLAGTFAGPKLFVPGNHELWTRSKPAQSLLNDELPRRVAERGWHWLPGRPWRCGTSAVVGSLGWYDYAFADAALGIPGRFYAAKVSPGACLTLTDRVEELKPHAEDVPEAARSLVARWNDGRHVKLSMPDERFLDLLLDQFDRDLDRVSDAKSVVAAVHHVPLRQLMPPARMPQWDFAHAYMGSPRLGELLLSRRNVHCILCGHSHFPAEARIGSVRAVNVGSGYHQKRAVAVETPA